MRGSAACASAAPVRPDGEWGDGGVAELNGVDLSIWDNVGSSPQVPHSNTGKRPSQSLDKRASELELLVIVVGIRSLSWNPSAKKLAALAVALKWVTSQRSRLQQRLFSEHHRLRRNCCRQNHRYRHIKTAAASEEQGALQCGLSANSQSQMQLPHSTAALRSRRGR